MPSSSHEASKHGRVEVEAPHTGVERSLVEEIVKKTQEMERPRPSSMEDVRLDHPICFCSGSHGPYLVVFRTHERVVGWPWQCLAAKKVLCLFPWFEAWALDCLGVLIRFKQGTQGGPDSRAHGSKYEQ